MLVNSIQILQENVLKVNYSCDSFNTGVNQNLEHLYLLPFQHNTEQFKSRLLNKLGKKLFFNVSMTME